MTPFPDDSKLVNFLRQHRAQAPPAAPELEDQILSAVEATPEHSVVPLRSTRFQQHGFPRVRYRFWIVSSAVAAGLVAGIVSYRSLMPTQPSAVELANLESFIENSWYGTVTDSPDSDLISANDS